MNTLPTLAVCTYVRTTCMRVQIYFSFILPFRRLHFTSLFPLSISQIVSLSVYSSVRPSVRLPGCLSIYNIYPIFISYFLTFYSLTCLKMGCTRWTMNVNMRCIQNFTYKVSFCAKIVKLTAFAVIVVALYAMHTTHPLYRLEKLSYPYKLWCECIHM